MYADVWISDDNCKRDKRIGLNELLNPPKDKDGRPMMRWAQKPDLWLRVIGGLVLIMLEPVSGTC